MTSGRRPATVGATVVTLLLAALVPAAVAGWSVQLTAVTPVGVATLHATTTITPVTETFRNDRFQVTTLASVSHDMNSPGHQIADVTITFASAAGPTAC